MRHDLVRDACDTGKVRVVCVRKQTYSLSKPLDIQKFYKHAKTVFNAVWCDLNGGVYC